MGFARGSGSGDLPKTASLESTTWKSRLLNLEDDVKTRPPGLRSGGLLARFEHEALMETGL